MAEQSFPFENIDTTESQFSQWARNFQSTGIKGTPVGTELKVSAAGTDMNISVASGQSFVRGHYYINTASKTLAVTSAGINTRIDIVVVELDPVANTIITKIVEGTAVSSSPVAPTLTQTDTGVYQLPIAVITIPNSTIAITSGMIADVRIFMSHDIGLWTTSTRPASPIENQTLGFNTTINQHEFWNGTAWVEFTPTDSVRKNQYTTTGDILVASAANTPSRLGIGANNTVLGSNGTTASWVAIPKPTKTTLLSGDVDKYFGNTAGYFNISRKVQTGGSDTLTDTGLLYIDGTVIESGTTNATVQLPVNKLLSANARIEYFPLWTTSVAVSGLQINGLSYGTGLYVAAHLRNGTYAGGITTSTDGTTWTNAQVAYSMPSTASAFAFGNGTFVATFGNNIAFTGVYTSTNGLSWTSRAISMGSTGSFSVAYGNGLFVICGYNNGILGTSTDGITWTTRSVASWTGAGHYSTMPATYGTPGWIMHSYTLNDFIYSTDGLTWTKGTTTVAPCNPAGSAFGNSTYVATGYSGTTRYVITASSISGPWTARTSGLTQSPNSIVFGAGLFVIGDDGGGIRTSPDGITWTARTSNITGTNTKVHFINGKFYATTGNQTSLQTSTDGITWTTSPGNGAILNSPPYGYGAYGNSTFLLDSTQRPAFSTDGITWSRAGDFYFSGGTSAGQYASIYANSLWVMVGQIANGNGGIQTSTNGITWTGRTISTTNTLRAVTYGTGLGYVAAGTSGYLATSTDAVTWTSRTSGFGTTQINALTFGAGKFLAGGNAGVITNSTDGVTWNTLSSPTGGSAVNALMYAGSLFYLGAENGGLYVSTDAVTWTSRTTHLNGGSIKTLAFANGTYAATGYDTTLSYYVVSLSTDGITWRPRSANQSSNPNGLAYGNQWIAADGVGNVWKAPASPTNALLFTTDFGPATALV